MTQAIVLEGTWDQVKEQAEELGRRSQGRRLKLILLDEGPEVGDEPLPRPSRPGVPVAEMQRRLDQAAARNRHLPVLPDEAFERESIYEDR